MWDGLQGQKHTSSEKTQTSRCTEPKAVEELQKSAGFFHGSKESVCNAANLLYEFTAKVALACEEHSVLFYNRKSCKFIRVGDSVFRELVKRFQFHTVDACEYGSDRKKATAFLANFRAVRLQQRCQGTHVHKPWNLEKTEDGQWRFDTASEAEYPTKLARELAASFLDELQTTRHFKFQEYLEDHAAKVSSEAQPRRTRDLF